MFSCVLRSYVAHRPSVFINRVPQSHSDSASWHSIPSIVPSTSMHECLLRALNFTLRHTPIKVLNRSPRSRYTIQQVLVLPRMVAPPQLR
jgi:hypothetical protein